MRVDIHSSALEVGMKDRLSMPINVELFMANADDQRTVGEYILPLAGLLREFDQRRYEVVTQASFENTHFRQNSHFETSI